MFLLYFLILTFPAALEDIDSFPEYSWITQDGIPEDFFEPAELKVMERWFGIVTIVKTTISYRRLTDEGIDIASSISKSLDDVSFYSTREEKIKSVYQMLRESWEYDVDAIIADIPGHFDLPLEFRPKGQVCKKIEALGNKTICADTFYGKVTVEEVPLTKIKKAETNFYKINPPEGREILQEPLFKLLVKYYIEGINERLELLKDIKKIINEKEVWIESEKYTSLSELSFLSQGYMKAKKKRIELENELIEWFGKAKSDVKYLPEFAKKLEALAETMKDEEEWIDSILEEGKNIDQSTKEDVERLEEKIDDMIFECEREGLKNFMYGIGKTSVKADIDTAKYLMKKAEECNRKIFYDRIVCLRQVINQLSEVKNEVERCEEKAEEYIEFVKGQVGENEECEKKLTLKERADCYTKLWMKKSNASPKDANVAVARITCTIPKEIVESLKILNQTDMLKLYEEKAENVSSEEECNKIIAELSEYLKENLGDKALEINVDIIKPMFEFDRKAEISYLIEIRNLLPIKREAIVEVPEVEDFAKHCEVKGECPLTLYGYEKRKIEETVSLLPGKIKKHERKITAINCDGAINATLEVEVYVPGEFLLPDNYTVDEEKTANLSPGIWEFSGIFQEQVCSIATENISPNQTKVTVIPSVDKIDTLYLEFPNTNCTIKSYKTWYTNNTTIIFYKNDVKGPFSFVVECASPAIIEEKESKVEEVVHMLLNSTDNEMRKLGIMLETSNMTDEEKMAVIVRFVKDWLYETQKNMKKYDIDDENPVIKADLERAKLLVKKGKIREALTLVGEVRQTVLERKTEIEEKTEKAKREYDRVKEEVKDLLSTYKSSFEIIEKLLKNATDPIDYELLIKEGGSGITFYKEKAKELREIKVEINQTIEKTKKKMKEIANYLENKANSLIMFGSDKERMNKLKKEILSYIDSGNLKKAYQKLLEMKSFVKKKEDEQGLMVAIIAACVVGIGGYIAYSYRYELYRLLGRRKRKLKKLI